MNDVIIIGGGPAGAILGSYLSTAGIRNTIFESAIHPRPHVGESLVPSTTRILQELGLMAAMEQEGFVKKYGAAWHAVARSGELATDFREFRLPGIDQDYTYHVDRGKFDLLLLKHAESSGSKVYQGVAVKHVLFEDGRASGVLFEIGGKTVTLPARVVVDASGRKTILGTQLKLKRKDPIFNQYAVHAWFRDVDRGNGPRSDFIHIYFLPVDKGWVWQIPITPEVTSMGVVAEKDVFSQSRADLDRWFQAIMRATPDLAFAMRGAQRINDYKREGDYSYSMDRFAGEGFFLIGDAARFVDPIFSSGVSVAAYSAKFAAGRIRWALETGDFGAAAFEPYELKVRRGVDIWYEFIRLYYKLVPLFTYFAQSTKHRVELLQLLQGEVFDRAEAPILDEMRKFIQTVEQSDSHILKEHLTAVPIG